MRAEKNRNHNTSCNAKGSVHQEKLNHSLVRRVHLFASEDDSRQRIPRYMSGHKSAKENALKHAQSIALRLFANVLVTLSWFRAFFGRSVASAKNDQCRTCNQCHCKGDNEFDSNGCPIVRVPMKLWHPKKAYSSEERGPQPHVGKRRFRLRPGRPWRKEISEHSRDDSVKGSIANSPRAGHRVHHSDSGRILFNDDDVKHPPRDQHSQHGHLQSDEHEQLGHRGRAIYHCMSAGTSYLRDKPNSERPRPTERVCQAPKGQRRDDVRDPKPDRYRPNHAVTKNWSHQSAPEHRKDKGLKKM